ncbi:MAG: DUF1854 domain-containing protein [Burkholderiales bacterium]
MKSCTLQLHRDAFGRLVWTDDSGIAHVGIIPVRAFPIAAPLEGVSLVGADGKERVWIAHMNELSASARSLIEAELAVREFMPVIARIKRVSTYSTPSVWDVDTDRGPTQLVLKGEEDIRRLSASRLLIADSQGIQFLVADRLALDKHSKRILERFL